MLIYINFVSFFVLLVWHLTYRKKLAKKVIKVAKKSNKSALNAQRKIYFQSFPFQVIKVRQAEYVNKAKVTRLFFKPEFHSVCYVGTMPRFVTVKTCFFGIIQCTTKKTIKISKITTLHFINSILCWLWGLIKDLQNKHQHTKFWSATEVVEVFCWSLNNAIIYSLHLLKWLSDKQELQEF